CAVAAFACLSLGGSALAADLRVPPPNAGAGCPPPAVQAQSRQPLKTFATVLFKRRSAYVQPPRVVTVEPFEGITPGPYKYIAPQTAFLASSPCPPSLGYAAGGNWYDGKLFYYDGPTPHRPDGFMIVVEPSVAHLPKRLQTR
ncbi:MAG: hypothetical protein ACTSU0_00725, partial [Alphaproteobacteria bacterium]